MGDALPRLPPWRDAHPVCSESDGPGRGPDLLTGNGPIVMLRSGHLAAAALDGGDVAESIVRLPHGAVEAEDNFSWNRVSWTVDGRRLVYVTKTEVRMLDEADGSDRLLLPCKDCEAALSPDGRRLAVTHDRLEIVDLVSGTWMTIPSGPGRRLTEPAWSPDGASLAVVTVASSARYGIAVVPADGSRAPVDVRSPSGKTWSISPAWSTDGRTIAYVEIGEPGATPHPIRVMTVSPNGSPPAAAPFVAGSGTCFQRVPGLTWSPDGTQLAVVDARGLEIADASVGAPLTLIAGAYASGSPAWRPVPPDPG